MKDESIEWKKPEKGYVCFTSKFSETQTLKPALQTVVFEKPAMKP